ncbi:MAG: hypothetical protein ACERJ1_13570 [Halodesulfovibrio sp.]|uniref:hypothetical protein n=1 Tax=Halodesulfovibrio sp. TaxID=1912772 RepID=UPI00359DFD7C
MVKNILPKSPIAAAGVGILVGAGIGGIKGWLGVRRGDTTQKEAVAGAIKQGLMFGGIAAVSTLASGSKGGGAGLATMAVMGLSRGSNALPTMLMGMTGGRGGGGGMGAGGTGASSLDFGSMFKTGGGQGAQGGRSEQRGQGGSSGKGGQAGNNQQRTQSEDRKNMSGTPSSGSILDTISNAVADMIIPDAKTDTAQTAQVVSKPEMVQDEVSEKVEPTVQSVVMESEGDAEGMHEDGMALLNQKGQADQKGQKDQKAQADQNNLAERTNLAGQRDQTDQIDPEDLIDAEDSRAKKIKLKKPKQGKQQKP